MKPTLYRLRPYARPPERIPRGVYRVDLDKLEAAAWVFVRIAMAIGAGVLVWSVMT